VPAGQGLHHLNFTVVDQDIFQLSSERAPLSQVLINIHTDPSDKDARNFDIRFEDQSQGRMDVVQGRYPSEQATPVCREYHPPLNDYRGRSGMIYPVPTL